jgi:hypothetical protein
MNCHDGGKKVIRRERVDFPAYGVVAGRDYHQYEHVTPLIQ